MTSERNFVLLVVFKQEYDVGLTTVPFVICVDREVTVGKRIQFQDQKIVRADVMTQAKVNLFLE
jgi:hypothetical protein